ncbi:hypothetical protein [Wolbachia endosymbiont (group A) of Sphaerophoria taeniata]|uniref:hypothetical protein n=1 Tax=Wolbachia endosymbiont (group A) of Sphaerophoria taeniata TaxID=2954057 RepID=UPI002225DBE4|nr:hypothetical protein [Wolbachia endosymbiont (group A) of Sphaerophoria taeniata]
MVTDTKDPFKDYFDFLGFRKLADQPSRILSSIRKYSGTISIASTIATLIAFTAFSIQPVTVSIAGFTFTPAPLAFIPLAVLLFTAVINFINTQKIKENEIDKKVGNYQVDEQYSQIVQEAEKIEIVTNLDRKRKKLSIVLPISKMQREILEDIKAENRNRIFLFTGSYVFGAIIVVSAISQSINVSITLISLLVVILVCIISTLSNLISNSVDYENHTIRNHSTLGLLLPYWSGKGMVVSVIENKLGKKENELISLIKELFGPFCDSFRSNLKKACDLLDNSLLKPANINIKETLGSIGKDLKALLDKLEKDIKKNVDEVKTTASKEITDCLKNISKSVDVLCKEVSGDVKGKLSEVDIEKVMSLVNNLSNLAETLEDRISRLKPGACMGLSGATFADERLPNAPNNPNPQQNGQGSSSQSNTDRSANKDMQTSTNESADQEIQTQLLEEHNRPSEPDNEDNTDQLVDEEKKLQEQMAVLEKQDRVRQLEKDLLERKRTDKWKEKINGKPSDFLYYLLESIKLEEKDNKEKKVEATLRDFDNKIIIHWKDGSQTTCHIKKQGDLPSTKVDFVNQNIQAAWEMARGKSL